MRNLTVQIMREKSAEVYQCQAMDTPDACVKNPAVANVNQMVACTWKINANEKVFNLPWSLAEFVLKRSSIVSNVALSSFNGRRRPIA
jgi:hypothetical protein